MSVTDREATESGSIRIERISGGAVVSDRGQEFGGQAADPKAGEVTVHELIHEISSLESETMIALCCGSSGRHLASFFDRHPNSLKRLEQIDRRGRRPQHAQHGVRPVVSRSRAECQVIATAVQPGDPVEVFVIFPDRDMSRTEVEEELAAGTPANSPRPTENS